MTKPVLYLPLLVSQAETLVDSSSSASVLLRQWDVPQLASVAVIQKLPSIIEEKLKNAMPLEKALANFIAVGTELSQTRQPNTFADLIASRFQRELFERGLVLMPRLQLYFLEEDALNAAQFLTAGQWDFNFCAAHSQMLNPLKHSFEAQSETFSLSNQQFRTFRVIHAEPDESIHIQGLAGTGKTHLIKHLVDSLSSSRPLVLALTVVQLQALMQRIGAANVRGMTFGELARYVLEQSLDYRRPGMRASSRYQLTSSDIASRLGFGYVNQLRPERVASVCANMVATFCSTVDPVVTEQHLRKGLVLNAVDRAVLVEYAQRLWDQTTRPTDPKLQLPIRGYHRIKQMAMLDGAAVVGPYFTHIIVDEAHNISQPLAAFLDRCEQPVITFGDEFQQLDGRFHKHTGTLRRHEITQSIRNGHQIEDVLNPLIEKHPVLNLAPMEGNTAIDTKVVYYDEPEVPQGKTTILVESEWGLFEWFQRLADAGASFSLLPGAANNFRLFIDACIRLFNEQVRPTHPLLFKYTNWDDLKTDMAGKNSSFPRIDRMLRRGYDLSHFEASLLKLDVTGAAALKLGRVRDACNSEIDVVMLAPDLLSQVELGDLNAASRAFAALYTGGSRARYKLIVPGDLRDWASDMSTAVKVHVDILHP